jgi:K+-sensing histidine kinase KdpD
MPDAVSDDNRPSPNALVEKAAQEVCGQMKVFLGAASDA